MNYEKNSHFSISACSSGCVLSDRCRVGGDLWFDVNVCVDHERPVHELHHVNVLLLSVSDNVLLSGSVLLCGHEVL